MAAPKKRRLPAASATKNVASGRPPEADPAASPPTWASTWPDAVRELIQTAKRWTSRYYHSEIYKPTRIDGPLAQKSLAVARILGACWVALVTEDEALEQFADAASKYLVQKGRDMLEKGEGMIDLGPYCAPGSPGWFEGVTDVKLEKGQRGTRAEHVMRKASTLAWRIEKGDSPAQLAKWFVEPPNSPFGMWEFLRENGVMLTGADAIVAVTADFERAFDTTSSPDPERLVVIGYRALGVPKNAAEKLFDWANKREKRGRRDS